MQIVCIDGLVRYTIIVSKICDEYNMYVYYWAKFERLYGENFNHYIKNLKYRLNRRIMCVVI